MKIFRLPVIVIVGLVLAYLAYGSMVGIAAFDAVKSATTDRFLQIDRATTSK
jgi:hypothetical protein